MKNPPLHRYATRPGLYFTDDGGADAVVRSETADQVWFCVLEPLNQPSAFYADAVRLFNEPDVSFIEQAKTQRICTRRIPSLNLRETLFHMDGPNYGLWYVHLPKAWDGMQYGYRVNGPWDPNHGVSFNPYKLLLDPYAKGIEGKMELDPGAFAYECEIKNGKVAGSPFGPMSTVDSLGHMPVSVAIDDRDINKHMGEPSHPHVPWSKTVIYELHVKGFTANAPWLPPELRGTYAGLAHPATLSYLQDLGVTSIELLPIQAKQSELFLQERNRTNYWGYSTLGYFAPEASYATKQAQEAGAGAVRQEVIDMVRAMHEAGFEVIMDVVYNHTAEGNNLGPTLSFKGIDNGAYYRLVDNDRRHYFDTTGTGNSLLMRSPHALQLITDSLRYWVTEMHVDGFRFDLAATLARQFQEVDKLSAFFDIVEQDPVISRVKLIAEPWDLGSGGYQVGGFPSSWSEWNGRYRDCVRDFWRSQPSTLPEFASRLMGSSDLYQMNGRRPVASVNFITAHDGFTMNDLVSYNEKHNDANGEGNRDGESNNRSWNCGVEGPTTIKDVNDLRQQQMRNMFATLLCSQGIPMICGGDEVARTQQGNNNAYCQDNAISWTNWDLDDSQKDLLEFVSKLIHLRLEHPVLHRRRFFTGREPGDPDDKIPQVEWMDHTGSIMDMEDWSNTHAFSVMIYLNGSDIPEADWYGNQMVDNNFILIFNAHYEPIMFTLPDERYGKKWRLVVDTHNPKGPELNYEAGFAITAQSRSFLLLMSDRKPTTKNYDF